MQNAELTKRPVLNKKNPLTFYVIEVNKGLSYYYTL